MKNVSPFHLRCQEYEKPLNWLKFNLYFRLPVGIITYLINIFYFIYSIDSLYVYADLPYGYENYTPPKIILDHDLYNSYIFCIVLCAIMALVLIVIIFATFKLKPWAFGLWIATLIISLLLDLILSAATDGDISFVIYFLLIDVPTIIYLSKRRDFVNPNKYITIQDYATILAYLLTDIIKETFTNLSNKLNDDVLDEVESHYLLLLISNYRFFFENKVNEEFSKEITYAILENMYSFRDDSTKDNFIKRVENYYVNCKEFISAKKIGPYIEEITKQTLAKFEASDGILFFELMSRQTNSYIHLFTSTVSHMNDIKVEQHPGEYRIYMS